MKKTFTLLMLTLFLSVLAFAQKQERPIPGKEKTPVLRTLPTSVLAKKSPSLDFSKVPFKVTSKAVTLTPSKAPKKAASKAPKKAPEGEGYYYSFSDGTLGVWTTIDADGDGHDWTGAGGTSLVGRDGKQGTLAYSQSYINNVGALKPDNYLVSPKMALDGKISFYAKGQDASWSAEHFGVAVSTNGNTSDKEFTTIAEWTATGEWEEYTVDLSEYAGQEGYVAIRHFNCTDQFYLDVDDITLYTSTELPGTDEPTTPTEPEEPTVVTPPADLETSPWIFRAMSISYDDSGNENIEDYSTSVNVGFDGDDVYVQGLCSYTPEAWIKGTRSGDQVVFKTDQYFGYYWYDFFFVGYGANGFGDVTMTMNADENKLTTEEWVLISTAPSSGEAFFIFADVEILKPVEKAATPETPTIDQVSLSGSYPYMYATIPIFDTEGDPLIGDNLSYQLYTEINHEQQPFVLTKDNYIRLAEDMTVIPYNFADGYDIFPGSQHQIYLNADDLALWNKVGIKAIYTGLGETHESEIFWYTIQEYPSHTVTIAETENGKVEADKESCPEADVVTLTVTPDEGYQLDALTVKDADGNDVKVTNNQFEMPLTDVTVTATFGKVPADVDVTVESGNDIYAAVNEAADGAPIRNLTITLEEDGEYPLSKSLTAAGNVTINGNGATVDASACKEIIKMTAGNDAEKNSKGFWELESFLIDGVTFKGATSYIYDDSKNPYIFSSYTINDCVFEMNQSSDQDTPFRFQAGGPVSFTMTNSTMYQTGSGNYKYLIKITSGNFPDKAFASFAGPYTWTIENNTFYNVFNKGELMNGGRVANNFQKTAISLQGNIFYDCFIEGEKFLKNLFGGKSGNDLAKFVSLTTDLNTYITGGNAVSGMNKYDQGTILTSDPGFADAAGGDFTLAFTSEQWAQKTGDPRWLDADPTVMVAPESGDFAAIVAQAVKEGKETLALPAGAAYKAGSTVYVDKKLNIIGDESDPATLELGMKGFVIKDALDMENMIIDAATNAEPFIALSAEPNEELLGANNGSDYYNIMDPVILRNLTITGVKGKLIYDNNKKYALDNLLIENCIVQLRTPKDKKETVIYMQGGGIRILEVNTSTFYQKGQGDNDYFVRYNNSARLDRMGYNKDMEAEDFVPEGFIYESNTFYKVAYEGQWGNYSGFNGQKFTAFTVNKNIWVDCGSGQIARRMLGSRGAEFYEVCEFDQNTYIYNGTAETEGTMKNGEPVGTYDLSGTAITKVPTFKQVATGDFTLDANDVQNKQQTGDPRWFAEEEATGIVNVNDNANLNDNQNAPAYNLAGQRVNAQTAKGIIIKNGRKYVK